MKTIKDILSQVVTDREAFIYLMVENGKMSYRDIEGIIGLSYNQVGIIYNNAKEKIEARNG